MRIEDTDRERSTEAAVQAIFDGLAWLELFADEPPDSPLFAEYSFISPEDLGEVRDLLRRLDERGRANRSVG